MVPSLDTENFSLPDPDKGKLMVAFSGSVAVVVAMVVPVEMSSENEFEATEVDRVTASFMLSTVTVILLLTVLVPSEAVKVKV